MRYENCCAIATSTAPAVILRHVITVLVFWQLDSDSVTMHPPARNPRQDVETNDIRTQEPTETPEAHMIRWSKLPHNCRRKHNILHGDETVLSKLLLVVRPCGAADKSGPAA